VVWEQRYFIVIESFEFYYMKLDVITREYALLQSNIEKTESPKELNNLKEKSRELLNM